MDFSFSGIKTAVLYHVQDLKAKGKKVPTKDICAAFQEAAFDMLLDKAKASLCLKDTRALLVGGGVSANSVLRERLKEMASHMAVKIFLPSKGMYMDNAAMVAGLAYHLYTKNRFSDYTLTAEPNLNFLN
jgi:N6-L-threonylcarbamoyladenine synthase